MRPVAHPGSCGRCTVEVGHIKLKTPRLPANVPHEVDEKWLSVVSGGPVDDEMRFEVRAFGREREVRRIRGWRGCRDRRKKPTWALDTVKLTPTARLDANTF